MKVKIDHCKLVITFQQLIVIAVYAMLDRAMLYYCSDNGITCPIGLASGLALSILLIGGRKYAYGLFIGAFIINVTSTHSFWAAMAISLGHTLEAFFASLMLDKSSVFNRYELSTRDYLQLLVFGGISSCIAAWIGESALSFSGLTDPGQFYVNLIDWWRSDVLGIILMTPLIMVWRRAPDAGLGKDRLIEFVIIIGLSFMACQAIFMGWLHESIGQIAKGYWMFLIVTWTAVRLEAHGVVIVLTMTGITGIMGVQQGVGFFEQDIIPIHAQTGFSVIMANYWYYMIILSVTGMTLGTYFVGRRQVEQDIVAKEIYQRVIFNATPDAMLITDQFGIVTQANKQAELVLNYTHEELIGESIDMLIARPLAIGSAIKVRQKSGDIIDIDISSSPIKTDQGLYYACSLRDVTHIKKVEERLRVAAIAFESNEPMIIADANSVIVQVNQAFIDSTGYSSEEAVGQKTSLLKSGRHDADFYKAMWEVIRTEGAWRGEIWDRRKNGEIYPKWLIISAVKNKYDAITHYVGTHIDITDRKAAEDQIRQLAFYDALTSLPNRRLLEERLKHSIGMERRDGKQLAVLMIDLDRFKMVNDSYGHLSGDELLQQVSARMTGRLRDVDMVARLGGDEFVVLLEDITHIEDAARVAEEIIADLSRPFFVANDHEVQIGASIGISLHPQHGNTCEELMDNADIALYQAKDAGRGCFAYFSEDITVATRERMALEARLRRAIEQQELRVHYQPQFDIKSGRITGAEALVRWQDPVGGLISPASFIPIAEESSLINVIGEWVLRETCRQGRQWLDAGLPLITLSVNVSSQQFRRVDICALIDDVLNETGFPAKQLEIEITESGLMDNQGNATNILNALREKGVRMAIDDFGTGYSSLAYLKHFPLDLLKIDKSFIDDIPHHKDDMEITATIIAMGHILGFKVLAEGVETKEQLVFLEENGCDMYQGYLSGRPIPADEFEKLLRQSIA